MGNAPFDRVPQPLAHSSTARYAHIVPSKLFWRLVPFLLLLYIVAYLDRINVGFAALQMKQQLNFTDAVYGLGAGMFFAGYFFFQVPSNLMLERLGARVWISVLMITWGIISGSMAFVSTSREFYVLRFALGVAEAGFFPGIILYMKRWFPLIVRARTVAWFMTAGPISGLIGGPISGAILQLHNFGSIRGWQWLFIMEGAPAVLLGLVAYSYLTERPQDAAWLDDGERTWLKETIEQESESSVVGAPTSALAAIASPHVWILAIIYLGINFCSYGMSFWLPSLIRSLTGVSDFRVGVLSAIPYVAAAIAMVLSGRHSDQTGERRWHVALPAFAGAAAFCVAANSTSLVALIVAISFALVGVNAMIGPYWAMPTTLLTGAAAASGIAFVNSIGNLGGFFGPYLIGRLRTSTGGFGGGLLLAAIALVIAGSLALATRINKYTTTTRPN